jgi:hypothetical protein
LDFVGEEYAGSSVDELNNNFHVVSVLFVDPGLVVIFVYYAWH